MSEPHDIAENFKTYAEDALYRHGDTRDMTTMKGRLARALTTQAYRDIFRSQSELEQSVENDWATNLPLVDAMLRELKNPSEEMISAMMHGFHLNKAPRQAMHDALVNGLCFIETET